MDCRDKKILFIINKHSGVGYQATVEGLILNACKENRADCTIEYTQRRGHAISLANNASKNGFDYVVAVGGDGTINEVAQGLLHSSTPMGILPRGSGNGLARHLGVPVKLSEAIRSLFSNKIVRIDTLTVNGKLSLNVSGIGFDGHIANLFADRKIRGLFGYVRLVLKELFNFQEFEAEISFNEMTSTQKAFIIGIANSSQYGNNIKIAPLASVCDGLLNITVLKKVPLYNLKFIYGFLRGSLKKSDMCDMLNATAVRIKTSTPVPYHVDGEPCGLSNSYTIQLNAASLPILVPPTFLT
ncbi:YegS/Rv2252/BmrU family lipid kinase [Chryseolinea sp. H1M3-3]|uniref:diacylglycerol/lipid kinase family protein n=1 Tax=Chryseolinea sp. H1M3-3 TaxID=3034144 RepID=UPI0023EA898C|nr:YegS/Rv2252/BmrU family lipid kinase [Chryseolinea sp. H1M3-3]